MFKKTIKIFVILSWLLGNASELYGFDLQLWGGNRQLDHNTLLGSERGGGWEAGLRTHVYVDQMAEMVGLGLFASQARYRFDEKNENAVASTRSLGTFDGELYGPSVQLRTPWPYLQAYLQFAYVVGIYRYGLEKKSNYSGSTLESKLSSDLETEVRGIRSSAGIRLGGWWGVFAEFNESRESLKVTTITGKTATTIDGEAQPIDDADANFAENIQAVVGEKFDHITRGFLFGVDIKY